LSTYATTEHGIQWHLPGQNYTGPGTHIVNNIINNVEPNNLTDLVTMMHDVDYMTDTTAWQSIKSDLKAIKNSDFSLQGLATKLGLTLRSIIYPNNFYGGDVQIGQKLKSFVKNSVFWQSQFNRYNKLELLKQW
jgi:endonuclease III-like uncharacterized protein